MPARARGAVSGGGGASAVGADDREQLSARVPTALLRRLRIAKVTSGRDIADIVAEAVAAWLDDYEAGG